MSDDTTQQWGYSKKGDQIFDLKPGEVLPAGYYDHPAKVPGSAAQKKYIADAEAEAAPLTFIEQGKASDVKVDPAK